MGYISNSSGSWDTTTVDAPETFQWPSLDIDSTLSAHLTFENGDDETLKYAQNTTGSWSVESIGNGRYNSLILDSSDTAHISSYYDGDLLYYTGYPGSWTAPDTLDSLGRIIVSTILVDSSGNTHIIYSDYDDYNVNYTNNTTGAWSTPLVIDSAGIVGLYSDAVIDSEGFIHISYYDYDYGNLKYATNSTGSWVTSTIDTTSHDVGAYNSIAVDSENYVHIVYLDSTTNTLKHITNSSGSWVNTTIASAAGTELEYTSIGIDSNDNIHVIYFDNAPYTTEVANLNYLTNETGYWENITLDNLSVALSYLSGISLEIDSNNVVHTAYGAQNSIFYATISKTCGDGETDITEECDDGNITDGDGCSSTCLIDTNTAPVANAGVNKRVTSAKISLNGSASYDPDGDTITYKWTLVSKPPRSSITSASITSSTNANAGCTLDKPGKYKFRLKVTDPEGETDSDFVNFNY